MYNQSIKFPTDAKYPDAPFVTRCTFVEKSDWNYLYVIFFFHWLERSHWFTGDLIRRLDEGDGFRDIFLPHQCSHRPCDKSARGWITSRTRPRASATVKGNVEFDMTIPAQNRVPRETRCGRERSKPKSGNRFNERDQKKKKKKK